jgi:DnaD/phage-associated family protein
MKGGTHLAREPLGTGELEFLQAFVQRGFVNIPRMLFDYAADLELDYDTIGKLFVVLACVGSATAEAAFGSYVISRRVNAHDFDGIRPFVEELQHKELVLIEAETETNVTFSFVPLFSRLRAIWSSNRDQWEEELLEAGPDPAVRVAEKLLGRPLTKRELEDIQDWGTSFGYEADMVEAIIREGLRQGVTRMSYLKQVARQWSEEGITTPEEAEQYIQAFRKSAGKHKSIVQYLGLKRQLTMAEQALLDKWTQEWGFSNEVVIRACAEAVGSQNPLQYVNKILESWLAQSVKTVADADAVMQKRRAPVAVAEKPAGRSRTANNSHLILQREKKDDSYYDHIFKKFGE